LDVSGKENFGREIIISFSDEMIYEIMLMLDPYPPLKGKRSLYKLHAMA